LTPPDRLPPDRLPPDRLPPAVALVGTTASGKSSLAMSVARRLGDVELVCVDSMTVYRGMDIGTAKPTPAERAAVPHHLLDLVDPAQDFTVREFQAEAQAARAGIAHRGRRALLVGGTGLYLRAVVDRLDIPPRYPEVAESLEQEADRPGGVQALYARLAVLDPPAAARTTDTNRRRIVRALEVTVGSGRPFSSYGPGLSAYPPSDVLLLGLPFVPEVVDRRIEERFVRWIDEGLVDEVRQLSSRPGGLSRTARQALGYKELLAHVEGGAPLAGCVEEAVRRTRTFARRQWAWFRRDPRIRWVGAEEDPAEVLAAALDGTPGSGLGAAPGLGAPPGLGAAVDAGGAVAASATPLGRVSGGEPVRDWS
jgi:tRNA dimethylallyltransferase